MSSTKEFLDAVERAKQVAAKLKAGNDASSGGGGGSSHSGPMGISAGGDGGGLKRPLESDSPMEMSKKMAIMQPRSQNSNAIVSSEYKVPDSMVGLIIGRGGEQINRIQSDSGCKVQMAPDSGGSSDRVCTLTGTQAAIDKCKEILGQIVASKMAEENQRPPRRRMGGPPIPDGQTVVELMLPAGKSGLVIGKGGETIRNIQTVANVKMVVIQDASGNINIEKPLRITGEPQNCEHAKQLVLEVLNKNGAAGMNDLQRNRARLEPGMQEVCYTIPANRCGIIIGKGGDSIRNIASQSGARIEISKMHSLNDPNDKTFIIRGTPQQIEHVENLFREKLSGDLPPPRMDITPGSYPPSHNQQMNPQQQQQQQQQAPYGHQGQQPPAQQWGNNPYQQQQWPQQPQQQPVPPAPQQPPANTDPNAAAWSAYYAQYYQYYKQQPAAAGQQPPIGQQQGHMTPQQPPMQQQQQSPVQQQSSGQGGGGQDYTQAWIQYYRANGMHKEAESLENQHRAAQQQQPKPQQGGPAAGQQWGGNFQQQQPFPNQPGYQPAAATGYQQAQAPQQQAPYSQQPSYPQGGGYNGPPSWGGPGNYNSQTGQPVAAPSQ